MTSTLRRADRHLRLAAGLLAVTAGLIGFSMAPSAHASTQIGATFVPTDGYGSGTYLQSVTPAGQYSAPTSGVITSWSYQAGSSPALAIKLKVARSAGGNDFTIVGESALKNPVLDMLNTYSVGIPVHAGDFLGLYNDTTNGLLSQTTAGYGYHSLLGTDVSPSNTPSTYIDSASANTQFDVSAVLEADCDGDGLGDETQDPDTSSCHPPAGTASAPTGQRAAALKKCKKKHSKKARKKCRKKAQLLPV